MTAIEYVAIGLVVGVILAAAAAWFWCRRGRQGVLAELRRFIGVDPNSLAIVSRSFPRFDLPNLQLAIDQHCKEVGATSRVIGYSSLHGPMGTDLQSMLGSSIPSAKIAVAPPVRREVDIEVDCQLQCVENGIHLIDAPDGRVAAHVFSSMFGYGDLKLEVLASASEAAGAFVERVRSKMAQCNVFRRKVISLECDAESPYGGACAIVRFHRLPKIRREEIILPPDTLVLLERNTTRFFEGASALRRSGHSVKRGILLHGKPGTGKTYTAKWLAGSMEDVTVILMTGENLVLVKQCCHMARMLAPALVIMEDVDLIASSREPRRNPAVQVTLHQLLNEMDGLAPDAEVLFLLTTNRPEAIETALAGRPGRVDQAIEYPLPDAECRRRLIELCGRGLNLQLADPEGIVARLDGASPAFVQELLRKAALIAADDESFHNGQIRVADSQLLAGLRELVLGGGELTKKLFGFAGDVSEI
jgi:hypothetical protein